MSFPLLDSVFEIEEKKITTLLDPECTMLEKQQDHIEILDDTNAKLEEAIKRLKVLYSELEVLRQENESLFIILKDTM